jgi:Brp/Blh family beta-carotene 15,15'-monooxygenase
MPLNKIQNILLIIFTIFGSFSYILFTNNFIQDDLTLLFFCFFLILVLGVSHGALDHIRGKRILEPKFNKAWSVLFFPGYIILGLIVIVSWVTFPPVTLLLFLIIAGYHFGEEDLSFFKGNNGVIFTIVSFLKGFLIITLSFHYSFENTSLFFEYLMVPQNYYEALIPFKSTLFSVNLICLVAGLIYLFKDSINHLVLTLLEVLLITLSFVYLPLILAFSLYFCFLHSSKHIIGLAKELDKQDIKNGLKLFSVKAVPLTCITALAAVLFVFLLSEKLDENIIKTIFIGLASLTLPHILLEILDKK